MFQMSTYKNQKEYRMCIAPLVKSSADLCINCSLLGGYLTIDFHVIGTSF